MKARTSPNPGAYWRARFLVIARQAQGLPARPAGGRSRPRPGLHGFLALARIPGAAALRP
jgi:hypothetical protein